MSGRNASEIEDFRKRWNESCMKENERVRTMKYTVEYLKEQSKRLKGQVKVTI